MERFKFLQNFLSEDEMAFELEEVVNMQTLIRFLLSSSHLLLPYAITCLEAWKDKLLIGTNDGVVIFKVAPNIDDGEIEGVIPDALQRNHIAQVSVMEAWESVIVLADGIVTMRPFHLAPDTNKFLFYTKNILPYKNVSQYTLLKSSSLKGAALCIASENTIYIHKASEITKKDGPRLFLAATQKLSMLHHIFSMALTETSLFVVYREETSIKKGCFQLDNNNFVEISKTETPKPPILRNFGCKTVFFQQDETISFHEDTSPITTMHTFAASTDLQLWNTKRKPYLVGVDGCNVSMYDLEGSRFYQTLILPDADVKLLHLSISGAPYVATAHGVWRILPSKISISDLIYSPHSVQEEKLTEALKKMEVREEGVPSPSSEEEILQNYGDISNCRVGKNTQRKVVPFDLIEALEGLNEIDVKYFNDFGIKYVWQFAQLNVSDLDGITHNQSSIWRAWDYAVADCNEYRSKLPPAKLNLPKPATRAEAYPEDLLEAIHMHEGLIAFLATLDIFTIRQFALMTEKEVSEYGDEAFACHTVAQECVKRHPEISRKIIEAPKDPKTMFGYIYMSEVEYARVVEHKSVKSPYVLFQEYINCPLEQRANHPWKDIYRNSKFGGTKMSDADLFTHLFWQEMPSFAKMDVTAGARAIYFHWDQVREHCLDFIDNASPNRLKFAKVVPVNLSLLCHNHGGKLFSVNGEEEWVPVKEDQISQIAASHNAIFEPKHFSNPTGCLVLPDGIIMSDCLQI